MSGLLSVFQQRDYRANLAGFGFVAFAAPLCLAALIFLALGLYFWLVPLYGAAPAFALTGGVLLALAGWFLYVGTRLLRTERLQPPPYTPQELSLLIDSVTRDMESEMSGTVQENPKTALAAAAIAGFLAGKEMFCRR